MALFDRLKLMLHTEDNMSESISSSKLNDLGSRRGVSVHGKQLNSTVSDRQKQVAQLTPRERDLYLLLLEGYTLKESAKMLSIKYSTANTHMTGVYKKLGVSTRAELIINYRDIGNNGF